MKRHRLGVGSVSSHVIKASQRQNRSLSLDVSVAYDSPTNLARCSFIDADICPSFLAPFDLYYVGVVNLGKEEAKSNCCDLCYAV